MATLRYTMKVTKYQGPHLLARGGRRHPHSANTARAKALLKKLALLAIR